MCIPADESTYPLFPLQKVSMATTLLTLPTEIRMLILTSVLTASSGYVRLTVAREGDSFEGVQRTFNVIEHESLQKNPRKISLCILRTCKQVYAESRGLIFKGNVFVFPKNQ